MAREKLAEVYADPDVTSDLHLLSVYRLEPSAIQNILGRFELHVLTLGTVGELHNLGRSEGSIGSELLCDPLHHVLLHMG